MGLENYTLKPKPQTIFEFEIETNSLIFLTNPSDVFLKTKQIKKSPNKLFCLGFLH
jgi:hypothetical protein